MIKRDSYIEKVSPFIDKPLIKVITGIRRCGKSVILKFIKEELLGRQIDENQIIYLNFESLEHSEIDHADKLYTYVKGRICQGKRNYILLDEIQEVSSWERAVNSFMSDFDSDIYITGSNSRLLSSELATYLTGRYVEIRIYTLSFSEYLQFKTQRTGMKDINTRAELETFLRMGGFPVLHIADYSLESAWKIVFDIYSSAILRDTVQRYNIRDVELLERVVKFVMENIGNKFSAKNIADYFKSQQRKIDLNTVYNYLNALQGAFIIDQIPRFDVKGKEVLKTLEKYFLGDHAIVYAVMGYRDRMISGILENMVMLELKRRGYNVYTGKMDEREIDFIAEKNSEKIYIQVTWKMDSPATIEREFSPLRDIRDNYSKYVVSMDDFWRDNMEGIRHVHLADFLLMENYG